jgi:outer membrane lipoprotein-sorting protein
MKTAGVLLLAAVFLAGCGGNDTAKKKMEARFLALDTQVAGMETINAPSTTNLEKATQQYIALVHQYRHELGPAEARRRLVRKGDEVFAYCFSCQKMFYDAARKY